MANTRLGLRAEITASVPMRGKSRKYKHVRAMDDSWHYDGPSIEMHVYPSGHCFLHVGDSLFMITRREVLEALQTHEWRRIS